MHKARWALTGFLAGGTLAAGCNPPLPYCEHPDNALSAACSLQLSCDSPAGIDLRQPTTLGLKLARPVADNLWYRAEFSPLMTAELSLAQSPIGTSDIQVPQNGAVQLLLRPADLESVLANNAWPRGGTINTKFQVGTATTTLAAVDSCLASVAPKVASTAVQTVQYPVDLSIGGTLYSMQSPLRVQIGAPDDKKALFVTEFYMGAMDFNYLERYQWENATSAPLRQSPGWYTQAQQQVDALRVDGPLFAIARDTVLLYRTVAGQELTTVTLSTGKVVKGWRTVNPTTLPKTASQLSAAADASWFVLADADYVQAFSTPPTLQALGSPLPIEPSLIAARAARPLVSTTESAPAYDVVAVSLTNKVRLLKVAALLSEPSTAASESATRALQDKLGSTQIKAVALADLNEDGLQDLLVMPVPSGGQGWLMWAAQRPDNTFAALAELTSVPVEASGVTVGDLLGDSLLELAVPVLPTGGARPYVQIYGQKR